MSHNATFAYIFCAKHYLLTVRANMAAPEEDRLPEEEIVGQMTYVEASLFPSILILILMIHSQSKIIGHGRNRHNVKFARTAYATISTTPEGARWLTSRNQTSTRGSRGRHTLRRPCRFAVYGCNLSRNAATVSASTEYMRLACS